jgi:hypothetical protein
MPIRDGYSATHAIRTESPWKDRPEIRSVPIVAMTASAIQGDKEKCQLAGMDDYLAKPVKGKLLEKVTLTQPHSILTSDLYQMLVKWAIEGRRKTAKAKLSTNDSDRHGGAATFPTRNRRGKDRPQIAGSPVEPETTAHALTAQLDRLYFENDTALARSCETDGDRALRRIQAEERDTMLRDDKLLSLTGPDMLRHDNLQSVKDAEAPMPLTEENIEKLVHGQDTTGPARKRSSGGYDSNSVNQNHSITRRIVEDVISRPSLTGTKHRESEQTITKGAPC